MFNSARPEAGNSYVEHKMTGSLYAIRNAWKLDATFQPTEDRTFPDLFHAQWLRAVERSERLPLP